MKFGKYIQKNVESGWNSYYMNYKELKKIIRGIIDATSDIEKQDARVRFFSSVEKELEKVSTFYVAKENELSVRLKTLSEKTDLFKRNSKLRLNVSLQLLQQAYEHFQKELARLQRYVETNATAFGKILKKFDKQTKSNTKELFLSSQYNIQPFFNRTTMTLLSDQATSYSLEVEDLIVNIENQCDGDSSHVCDPFILIKEKIESNDIEGIEKHLNLLPLNVSDSYLMISLVNSCFACGSMNILGPIFERYKGILVTLKDDINGRGLVHEACIMSNYSYLVKCVEEGVDVMSNDFYGRTPLHYCAMNGFEDGVRYLLENGAFMTKDHVGHSPLILALIQGQATIVSILLNLDQSEVEEGIMMACEHGRVNVVDILLKANTNYKFVVDSSGLFPLHVACREGFTELANLLINYGHDINIRDKYQEWTPLFYAASEGCLDCVSLLVEKGCIVDVRDEHQWTPYMYALFKGHKSVATLLAPNNLHFVNERSLLFESSIVKTVPISPVNSALANDVEELPALELPPPMLIPRIHGHPSIKHTHIRVTIKGKGVEFFNQRHFTNLKLKMSQLYSVDDSIQHRVALPLQTSECWTFSVHGFSPSPLVFLDVSSSFGSSIMARGVLIVSPEMDTRQIQCPLLDPHLHVVGKVDCSIQIVFPLEHQNFFPRTPLYWKSLNNVGNEWVAESSMDKCRFLTIPVAASKDNIPLVSFDMGASFVNYSDLLQLCDISIAKDWFNVNKPVMALQQLLEMLPITINLMLVVNKSIPNNESIDNLILTLYQSDTNRKIALTSFNPRICVAMNLKQSNYPVLLGTYGVRAEDESEYSLEQSIDYVKANNLVGIFCAEKELIGIKDFIKTMNEKGLITSTFE